MAWFLVDGISWMCHTFCVLCVIWCLCYSALSALCSSLTQRVCRQQLVSMFLSLRDLTTECKEVADFTRDVSIWGMLLMVFFRSGTTNFYWKSTGVIVCAFSETKIGVMGFGPLVLLIISQPLYRIRMLLNYNKNCIQISIWALYFLLK